MTPTPATLATIARLIQCAAHPRSSLRVNPFGDVKVDGHRKVSFDIDMYAYNSALAVHLSTLVDDDSVGEQFLPFATLSVNDIELSFPPGHFLAKTFGENTAYRENLLKEGWFTDTGERCISHGGAVEVWKLTQKFCDAFIAAHQAELRFLQETMPA